MAIKSPLEDTIWGAKFGSVAAVRAAFDQSGSRYHDAIMRSGVPDRAAALLAPHLTPGARGIDFGCGGGAMGIALRGAGFDGKLDGVDLSDGMLTLARQSGCYAELTRVNLLSRDEASQVPSGHDFAVELGLIGDYLPYYFALPLMVAAVKPGGLLGFGVEPKSTPQRPLFRVAEEKGLEILSETVLEIPAGVLELETYQFFVARLSPASRESE